MPRSLEGQLSHTCSDLRSGKRRSNRPRPVPSGLAGAGQSRGAGRVSLARLLPTSALSASRLAGRRAEFPPVLQALWSSRSEGRNMVRDPESTGRWVALAMLVPLMVAQTGVAGSIRAWGFNGYGGCDAPAGDEFVAVAGGGAHSMALTSDGSIVSWGWDQYGQVAATPAQADFTAICGGGGHSLALRSNGSVVSWGWDSHGQVANTPLRNDISQIACGEQHSVALTHGGGIISWGSDSAGQVSVHSGDTMLNSRIKYGVPGITRITGPRPLAHAESNFLSVATLKLGGKNQ